MEEKCDCPEVVVIVAAAATTVAVVVVVVALDCTNWNYADVILFISIFPSLTHPYGRSSASSSSSDLLST